MPCIQEFYSKVQYTFVTYGILYLVLVLHATAYVQQKLQNISLWLLFTQIKQEKTLAT